jgi:hypothetical protein
MVSRTRKGPSQAGSSLFSLQVLTAHDRQAGAGEQESQVEEPVLTILFS